MNAYKAFLLTAVLASAVALSSAQAATATHAAAPIASGSHGGWHGGSNNWRGGNYGGWYGRHHHWHGGDRVFVDVGFGYPFGWGYPYGYGWYPYGGYPYYAYDPYYGAPVRGEPVSGNGSYGSVVARVQQRLARAGYYHGAIDGVAGNGTRRAIRAYERAHGLPVDGQIDRELLATMGLA